MDLSNREIVILNSIIVNSATLQNYCIRKKTFLEELYVWETFFKELKSIYAHTVYRNRKRVYNNTFLESVLDDLYLAIKQNGIV